VVSNFLQRSFCSFGLWNDTDGQNSPVDSTVRPHSSLGYGTPEEFAAANGCGKDGGFATLENRYAFPTLPQPRRRRPNFDLCSGTKNPGSFVMNGPKTGGRSVISGLPARSLKPRPINENNS
jgi:hypothetical protein